MSNQRKVTVFTSKGGKQVIETSATTWGELKPLVEEHYDLENLQPTENITKTTLLHVEAALPASDFVLFLRPIKTKSGANYEDMGFKELRALLTDEDKVQLAEEIGRNWTTASTQDLRDFFTTQENASIIQEDVVLETAKVTDKVKAPKTIYDRLEKAIKTMIKVYEISDDEEIIDRADCIISDIEVLSTLLKAEESVVEAEVVLTEEEKAEEERLKAAFEAFNEGF